MQTDIEFLAEEMFALFRANERLEEIETAANPFPVKTEREQAVEDKELPVYRAMFEKTGKNLNTEDTKERHREDKEEDAKEDLISC